MKHSILIICFALFIAVFRVCNSFAQDTPPNDEIWYTSMDGQVVTPYQTDSSYYGAEIMSNNYNGGKGIIKFNGNVTSIGYDSFYYRDKLASIILPNSVTNVGKQAFYQCSNLYHITIGVSVTSIGNAAFSYCYSLNTIVVKDGNLYYDSRNNCNAIIKTSTNTLIVGCKNTIIPNSVTSIGDSAFAACSSLTKVYCYAK